QAEDGIRDFHVTGVQTCALPIFLRITGPSGTVAMRSVPTPLACDPSCEGTKRYELPIPGRSYVDEICGGLACGDRPADFTDGVRSEERRVGKERRARAGSHADRQ